MEQTITTFTPGDQIYVMQINKRGSSAFPVKRKGIFVRHSKTKDKYHQYATVRFDGNVYDSRVVLNEIKPEPIIRSR